MKNPTVSRTLVAGVIAAELIVIVAMGWIGAGFPGLRRDDGRPTITYLFGPAHQQPLGRAHSI